MSNTPTPKESLNAALNLAGERLGDMAENVKYGWYTQEELDDAQALLDAAVNYGPLFEIAPNLLEALEACVGIMMETGLDLDEDFAPVLDKADSVIAKAKSEV